jgi:NarL family two-component system response regulator LiaR
MTENNQNPIRVVIVDDHPVVRNGIRFSLLSVPDIELVGTAGNGLDGLRLCDEARPDVVLMDMKMPGGDGLEATRVICERYPDTQVIILTSYPERELVKGALQAGAISYLLKDIAFQELAAAIRLAHAGQSTLAPEATHSLYEDGAQEVALDYHLTPREREILALVAQGLQNEEIAGRLNISLSTVRFHNSNIYSKMGVANRAEAAALAVKMGLV